MTAPPKIRAKATLLANSFMVPAGTCGVPARKNINGRHLSLRHRGSATVTGLYPCEPRDAARHLRSDLLQPDGIACSRPGGTRPRRLSNVSTPNAAKIIRHGSTGVE